MPLPAEDSHGVIVRTFSDQADNTAVAGQPGQLSIHFWLHFDDKMESTHVRFTQWFQPHRCLLAFALSPSFLSPQFWKAYGIFVDSNKTTQKTDNTGVSNDVWSNLISDRFRHLGAWSCKFLYNPQSIPHACVNTLSECARTSSSEIGVFP